MAAEEIVKFVHGEAELIEAQKITEALFNGNFSDLKESNFKQIVKIINGIKIEENSNLVDVLVETQLASSKREAREFINNGAISVNDEKINDTSHTLNSEDAYYHNYCVIKRGRRRHAVTYFK